MTRLAHYRVTAFNTSWESDNKIHDDAVARRLGFAGGLVPGVDVYAYMAHAPVARWGREWLERGTIEARFTKPVYDGAETVVSATLEGDVMNLAVESGGLTCAVGTAGMNVDRPATRLDDFPRVEVPAPLPPASPESLAAGVALGAIDDEPARGGQADYLKDVREDQAIYADAGLAHPGYLLRRANVALRENVTLGPWIHVESKVWNIRALSVDEPFTTRAVVLDNYEKNGHLFVDLDVVIAARDRDPVCRVRHKAIYVPRQLRETTET